MSRVGIRGVKELQANAKSEDACLPTTMGADSAKQGIGFCLMGHASKGLSRDARDMRWMGFANLAKDPISQNCLVFVCL